MSHKLILTFCFVLVAIGGSVLAANAQGPRPGGSRAPATLAGPAFTYQGQLRKNGALADGTCDLDFGLWDSDIGGIQLGITQSATSVLVTNGLFGGPINGGGQFGPNAFNGDVRLLQIALRCPAGAGAFTALTPRQVLNAAPYAHYALGNLNRNSADASSASISASGGVLYDLTQSNTSAASSARSVLRLNDNTTTPGINDFLITARNNTMTKFSVRSSGDVELAGGDLKLSNAGSGISFPDSSKQTTAAPRVLGYDSGVVSGSYLTTTEQVLATLPVTVTGPSGVLLVGFGADYVLTVCSEFSYAQIHLNLYRDNVLTSFVWANQDGSAPDLACKGHGSTLTQFRQEVPSLGAHTYELRALSTLTTTGVNGTARIGIGWITAIQQ